MGEAMNNDLAQTVSPAAAPAPEKPAEAAAQLRRVGRPPADEDQRKQRVEAALAELRNEGRDAFGIAEVAARSGVSRATIYRSLVLRALVGQEGQTVDANAPKSVSKTPPPDGGDAAEILRLHKQRLRGREAQQRERLGHLRDRLREEQLRVERFRQRTDQAVSEAQRSRETLSRQQQRVLDLTARLRVAVRKYEEADMRARSAEQVADQQARLREDAEARAADRSGVQGDTLEQARKAGYQAGYEAGNRVAARAARRDGGTGLAAAVSDLTTAELVAARRKLARVLHPDLFADDPHTNLLANELLKQINSLAVVKAAPAVPPRRK